MKLYFVRITIVLIFLNGFYSCGQNRETRIDEEFPTQEAFPNQYFGEYSGNLRVADGEGVLSNIPMEFSFLPSDREGAYKYKLVYITKSKRETQNYVISPINIEKGAYLIEGDDRMKFPATKIDDTFYSTFVVENNIMTTKLEFNKNGKVYLTINKSSKIKVEEGKGEKEDVYAYVVNLNQRAYFVKNAID